MIHDPQLDRFRRCRRTYYVRPLKSVKSSVYGQAITIFGLDEIEGADPRSHAIYDGDVTTGSESSRSV